MMKLKNMDAPACINTLDFTSLDMHARPVEYIIPMTGQYPASGPCCEAQGRSYQNFGSG